MKKPKGLGRGLDALLGADAPATSSPDASSDGAAGAGLPGAPASLPLDRLRPGRYQPRTRMDEAALQELAESIRTHGLMQPVVVRPVGAGAWEIVAGERRTRAARLAGLTEVAVIVRDVPDEQALALALIENIQREDLNPLEEAQAVRRLIDEFGYTHERAAEAIGRSRSATSNLLRLLNLAPPVQTMLLAGDLEMGHARALLALDAIAQAGAAQRIVDRRLSVREAEALVARMLQDSDDAHPRRRASGAPDPDVARLQERLSDLLATPVEIRQGARGKGSLVIHFADPDIFTGVLKKLNLGGAVEE